MGLLDKFFGGGFKRDRVGNINGHVEHLNETSALVYGEDGMITGTIETYGNEVYRYDSNGMIVSMGEYDNGGDTLTMFNSDGSYTKYTDAGDRAYATNMGSYFPMESYASSEISDCSCSDNDLDSFNYYGDNSYNSYNSYGFDDDYDDDYDMEF